GLDEAWDGLWTLVQVGGAQLSSPDAVAVRLRLGRVNRKQNRFDEAEAAYTEAGVLAAAAGDQYSELLSRIGRANTLLGRGNLAEAERCLQGIRADFYLKQGIGQARFGQFKKAEGLMQQALEIASSARLHEFEFRIERIKNGLRDCESLLQGEQTAATEPVFDTQELREVSASL